jgi:hypothetical protein
MNSDIQDKNSERSELEYDDIDIKNKNILFN